MGVLDLYLLVYLAMARSKIVYLTFWLLLLEKNNGHSIPAPSGHQCCSFSVWLLKELERTKSLTSSSTSNARNIKWIHRGYGMLMSILEVGGVIWISYVAKFSADRLNPQIFDLFQTCIYTECYCYGSENMCFCNVCRSAFHIWIYVPVSSALWSLSHFSLALAE